MVGDRRRFAAIQRSGLVRSHPLLLARFLANDDGAIRWGFATGKRLGGAVVRNRVRRRLREGARAILPRIEEGWDIMIIARPESARANSAELHAAVADLARRGGILQPVAESKLE